MNSDEVINEVRAQVELDRDLRGQARLEISFKIELHDVTPENFATWHFMIHAHELPNFAFDLKAKLKRLTNIA